MAQYARNDVVARLGRQVFRGAAIAKKALVLLFAIGLGLACFFGAASLVWWVFTEAGNRLDDWRCPRSVQKYFDAQFSDDDSRVDHCTVGKARQEPRTCYVRALDESFVYRTVPWKVTCVDGALKGEPTLSDKTARLLLQQFAHDQK